MPRWVPPQEPLHTGMPEGYFLYAGAQGLAKQLAAFWAPFLDASQLTPEVQAVIKDIGKVGNKTIKEWEEFILHAMVAWHAAQQEGACRGGQGILEGSKEDTASSKSGVYLPDKPANFKFAEPQEFGDIMFDSPPKGEDDNPGEGKEEEKVDVPSRTSTGRCASSL
jgi:hypothetical protein